MSYSSDNRDYREPHRHNRGYAADYYEEHPVNRDYARQRDYRPRQPRHSRQEPRRRPSSIGGDTSYDQNNRSHRGKLRAENGSYFQRPEYNSSSESDRSSYQRNRRRSTAGSARDAHRDQDRSRSRDRGEDNSKGHGWANTLRDKGGQMIVQAALPLIAAGAAEALRSRKEPGEWRGDKGKHVVKAAVANGLVNKDPSKPHAHHIVDTTVSGLKGGYPTRDELAAIQRRAGGNRTMSNAKKVAAAGAIAFAGIEIYDRYGRSRSLKRSETNDKDSVQKKRSQSVSDEHCFNDRRGSFESDESDYRTPRSQYRDSQPDQWERSYYGRDHDNRYRNCSPGGY